MYDMELASDFHRIVVVVDGNGECSAYSENELDSMKLQRIYTILHRREQ